MHIRAGRPAEPEQADGDHASTEDGDRHAFLGFEVALLRKHGFLDILEVWEVSGRNSEGTKEDTDVG